MFSSSSLTEKLERLIIKWRNSTEKVRETIIHPSARFELDKRISLKQNDFRETYGSFKEIDFDGSISTQIIFMFTIKWVWDVLEPILNFFIFILTVWYCVFKIKQRYNHYLVNREVLRNSEFPRFVLIGSSGHTFSSKRYFDSLDIIFRGDLPIREV